MKPAAHTFAVAILVAFAVAAAAARANSPFFKGGRSHVRTSAMIGVRVAPRAEPRRRGRAESAFQRAANQSGGVPVAAPPFAMGIFLAADADASGAATEIRNGALLAIAQCQDRCRAIEAAAAGSWHSGVSELVRLVYEDDVSVVLGAADAKSAHLTEQVVARAKGDLLFVTPWATDVSLTRIGIPWFFRVAHGDDRQTESLVHEMRDSEAGPVVVLTAEGDRDGAMALEALRKAASTDLLDWRELRVEGGPAGAQSAAERLRSEQPGAVLFLLPPADAARAARSLRDTGVGARYYGTLRLACAGFLEPAGQAAEGMVLSAPPELPGPAAAHFSAAYRDVYGRDATSAAAHGFDAASVVIEASRRGADDGGERLREALAATRHRGLTGSIEFDAAGNRAGPAPLSRLQNGRLTDVSSKKGYK